MTRSALDEGGISLVETLVAALLVTIAVLTLAQLLSLATRSTITSRAMTLGVILAEQKLEQLRALAWGLDGSGAPVSDFSSDTASGVPPTSDGTGLQMSPAGTLQRDTPGFVDYLDAMGVVIGASGASVPPDTVFTRRWSIEPLAAAANQSVLIQVLVTPSRGSARGPSDVRLAFVKTRKAL